MLEPSILLFPLYSSKAPVRLKCQQIPSETGGLLSLTNLRELLNLCCISFQTKASRAVIALAALSDVQKFYILEMQ